MGNEEPLRVRCSATPVPCARGCTPTSAGPPLSTPTPEWLLSTLSAQQYHRDAVQATARTHIPEVSLNGHLTRLLIRVPGQSMGGFIRAHVEHSKCTRAKILLAFTCHSQPATERAMAPPLQYQPRS